MQVYKLYGGPDGFMLSTGVAEPDEHHAANLLRAGLQIACLTKRVCACGPAAPPLPPSLRHPARPPSAAAEPLIPPLLTAAIHPLLRCCCSLCTPAAGSALTWCWPWPAGPCAPACSAPPA